MTAPALQIQGLSVAYGDKPALRDMTATVPQGSMTAIIGPNGAGKSTLLKAALGVVRPLSGTVQAFGAPIDQRLDRIAYVPQRSSVDWDFPACVLDVVLMGMYRELGLIRRIRPQHRDRAMACLEQVGMTDFVDRQIGQLSGGQQQRVFLARALAQNADLYLLDEPFAGVDAATEAAIISVLKSLKDQGRTLVVVHHDLSTVAAYFDRVLLVNVTRVAEGPLDKAFSAPLLQQTYGGHLMTGQIPGLSAVAFEAAE